MAELVSLINALAALIWPMLLAYVLWLLMPPLQKIIASRSFSLKFSGLELSVQEATEQISSQLKDLQDQMIALQAKVAEGEKAGPMPPGQKNALPGERDGVDGSRPGDQGAAKRILWVDDQPRNNALEVSQLESKGYRVFLAQSTADAMQEMQRQPVDMIISDMGRRENGVYVPDAGVQLLRSLREQGHMEPFKIYSSAKYAVQNDVAVKSMGGDGATASTLGLMGWIQGVPSRQAPGP